MGMVLEMKILKAHKQGKRYKRPGSILMTSIVAVIVWIFIAQCMFVTSAGGFEMIKSSRTALQSQQYAQITIDRLKRLYYDELDEYGAHDRAVIPGLPSDDWEDEVTIGPELDIPGSEDIKQRIATVNIYKKDDTLPRYSVEVPFSSLDSRGETVGTIVPRMNDSFISETEKKQYLLCDGSTYDTTKYRRLYKVLGTNRLPNLQGVFLRGYGSQSSYTSGALGQLQGDAMRKIYGDIPNVQFGKTLFGHYEFGPFILRGYSGYWPSGVNKWVMTSYPEYFPIYRYSITGSSESGYELIEQEYHIKTDISVKQIDSALGQGFQTVSFDSSKIIPTASEIRPANIAVKYYIRAN